MVIENPGREVAQRGDALQDLRAVGRMGADVLELLVGEAVVLGEHAKRHAELTEVVEVAARPKRRARVRVQPEPLGHRHGQHGHAPRVAGRVRVLCVDQVGDDREELARRQRRDLLGKEALRCPQYSVPVRLTIEMRDRPTPVQCEEALRDLGSELLAGARLHHFGDRLAPERRTVGSPRGERRHRIGQPQNARAHGDLVGAQPVGVAAPVPPLVMVSEERREVLEVRNALHPLLRALRMPLDALPDLRGQRRRRVLPGILGQADHPHVREHRREEELGARRLRVPQLTAQLRGEHRDHGSVILQVSLGRTHDPSESLEEACVERPA
jgi:hypothetical protein